MPNQKLLKFNLFFFMEAMLKTTKLNSLLNTSPFFYNKKNIVNFCFCVVAFSYILKIDSCSLLQQKKWRKYHVAVGMEEMCCITYYMLFFLGKKNLNKTTNKHAHYWYYVYKCFKKTTFFGFIIPSKYT